VDASTFDRLTVTIAERTTRRAALALLSTIGFGTLLVEEARAQTCLANGERCDPKVSPNGCCSGRCPRKKKRCRPAFKQDTCTVEDNVCTSTGNFSCGPNDDCLCRLTIDGQSFCSTGNDAVDCTTHKECEQRLGNGSRCCPLGDLCSGGGTGNECAQKCPNVK
jgi:hypothetical protein